MLERALNEPIAALATPAGVGALAVVRLTGLGCLEALAPLLVGARAEPLAAWPERSLRLCRFLDPFSSETIDEPLAVVFRAPHSYTGEDAAEIHCHGGPYIVARVLETLYRHGFRPAEAGEFTRRAFLNGKLDLTRAEGIRALAFAESRQEWQSARQLADGKLAKEVDGLRQALLAAMAQIEAQIDFPDEGDVARASRSEARRRVVMVQERMARLSASYESGRVASLGLSVALLGAPNAGKSSLMNALLGRERAIVSRIAGTTRDYIEERCLVDGRLIRLIDMAGVRETEDEVERIGVDAARRIAREADVVLLLLPADAPDPGAERQELAELEATLALTAPLVIATKCDLRPPPAEEAPGALAVSALTGAGMVELRARLAALVDQRMDDLGEEAYVTTPRHRASLARAAEALKAYCQADDEGAYEELLAFELADAAKSLRAIVGSIDGDDILDLVFREFCIGK